jgi:hypothetical protein
MTLAGSPHRDSEVLSMLLRIPSLPELDCHVSAAIGNMYSNEDSSAGEGDSTPLDGAARKKRKFPQPGLNAESIAVAIEKANGATLRTMLECEDRRDKRHKEKLELNERIANGYMTALSSIADALRHFDRTREVTD